MTLPFSRLVLSMIRGEDLKPRLKLKAAKTRTMVPVVLRLLESHFPPQNERQLRRHKCLEFLNLAYEELSQWGEGSAAKLENFCRRHLLLYLSLSREAVEAEANWVSWRWYPKHHMLLHLSAEQSRRFGSPKSWWCYQDEGSIGLGVDLAESNHPRTLPMASFSKYLPSLWME